MVRVALLIVFTIVPLLIIGTGVVGLVARSKLAHPPKTRMLVTGLFRIAVGLIVLGLVIRAY